VSSLADRVVLVTGASRGAGRGVALALGDAGATVYVTGRSTRDDSTAPEIGGTVDDTADEVTRRGGRGVAVRCDHTVDTDNDAVFERIRRDHGRLDVLVNAAWGGNEIAIDDAPFWEQPMGHWNGMYRAGVRATLACSRLAAPMMIARRRGLIVHISFWDRDRFAANLFYDVAKVAMNRMAFGMARELAEHLVAVVALSPGFMRTERVLAAHTAAELAGTESPEYVGRAVAALAADPNILERSGRILTAAGCAREYGFTDIDGTQPEPFRLPD
jgi:NAD(P)-dependent dehydrogenase (short-subunit alcohol dehydrogenase family)